MAHNSIQEHYARYEFALPFCKDKRVIDVACGPGYGTYKIGSVASYVAGVDVDSERLEGAKRDFRGERIEYFLEDATALHFPDDSFDVAISMETIEHISLSDQKKFLAQLRRLFDGMGS